MPGKKDSSNPHAQYLTDWAIYRASVEADDDPGNPSAVSEVLDTTSSPSACGLQVWLVVERLEGAGTVDVALVRSGNGSLALAEPYRQVGAQAAMDTLQERRFTQQTPGLFRVLLTNMDAGAKWRIHYATLTTLGASSSITVTSVGGAVLGGVVEPNGAITAPQYSIYSQYDGGGALIRIWFKSTADGDTGWV